uniref:Uncharacterized protein n=1 Tax=Clastoptera arizonana TaxID=38151 RepID=A0A1B6CDC0_9HEMI
MDSGVKVESGLQLVARLQKRPSLNGLDDIIFPHGPNPQEVIEIIGEPSSGKTFLITKFIAKSILPKYFNNIHIGGLDASVVLINIDYHFQICKLISLMENHLTLCNHNNDESSKLDENCIKHIICTALKNFIMYNCINTFQLLVTFHSIHNLILNNTEISLIIIDSISANYWLDVMNGSVRKMDLYSKNILEDFQKTLNPFKVVLMYTRPLYFQSKTRKNEVCSAQPGFGKVNQYVHLFNVSKNTAVYGAQIITSSQTFTRFYKIHPTDLVFLGGS